jgi:hypothetical protein
MKLSYQYPSWELHPRKLTQQEADKPFMVVNDFFDYASLPQVRDLMWQWLETTVTGSFAEELTGPERARVLVFFQQLEKLIEAAHVIHVSHHPKKKKPGKKKTKK